MNATKTPPLILGTRRGGTAPLRVARFFTDARPAARLLDARRPAGASDPHRAAAAGRRAQQTKTPPLARRRRVKRVAPRAALFPRGAAAYPSTLLPHACVLRPLSPPQQFIRETSCKATYKENACG
jgi:hypothetical protein